MGERFAEIVAAPAYGHKLVCASLPEGCTEVGSPGDLQQWLRRIATECPRPLLAEVVRADGDRLSVGLGRSRSFLTCIPEDGDPPYFSVGAWAAYLDQDQDCERAQRISMSIGRTNASGAEDERSRQVRRSESVVGEAWLIERCPSQIRAEKSASPLEFALDFGLSIGGTPRQLRTGAGARGFDVDC